MKSMGVIQGYRIVPGVFEMSENTNTRLNLSNWTILYICRLHLERIKGICQISCKIVQINCQITRLLLSNNDNQNTFPCGFTYFSHNRISVLLYCLLIKSYTAYRYAYNIKYNNIVITRSSTRMLVTNIGLIKIMFIIQ